MFRRLSLPAAVGLVLAGGATAQAAPAEQWAPGAYMEQALGRVMGAGLALDEKLDYGFDGDGFCLLGTLLRPEGATAFNRPLKKGETYAFVGAGDDDAKDVDLEILDEAGNVLASDTQEDSVPVIEFKPKKSGNYVIRVTLVDAADPCFCAVATMIKGKGYDVPAKNLTTAGDAIIEQGRQLARLGKAGFLAQESQFTLWAILLGGGESVTVSHVCPGAGKTVFAAVGDTQAKDIDLTLLSDDGDELAKDAEEDARPVVSHDAEDETCYQLKIENAAAGSPVTLVVAAGMKLVPE